MLLQNINQVIFLKHKIKAQGMVIIIITHRAKTRNANRKATLSLWNAKHTTLKLSTPKITEFPQNKYE